jgi:hypothetical protein
MSRTDHHPFGMNAKDNRAYRREIKTWWTTCGRPTQEARPAIEEQIEAMLPEPLPRTHGGLGDLRQNARDAWFLGYDDADGLHEWERELLGIMNGNTAWRTTTGKGNAHDEVDEIVYADQMLAMDDWERHERELEAERDEMPHIEHITYAQACQEFGHAPTAQDSTITAMRGWTRKTPSGTSCPKMRVYELARELGIESSVLVRVLREDLNEYVKGAQSTLVMPVVRKVMDYFPSVTNALNIAVAMETDEPIRVAAEREVEQFFGIPRPGRIHQPERRNDMPRTPRPGGNPFVNA